MSTIRLNIMEQGRATEWLCSLVLLFFAVCLALPGNTLTSSSGFRAFLSMGLDEASIATPMALIAALRLSALHINGNWERSPYLRMAGSMFGSAIFATLAMAFFWPTLAYGSPLSSGVFTYLLLALFDGLSAYRSGADARMVQCVFKEHR
mgnify:FL=1|tara:strand:- start:1328 stop:1777 length:450 start_codon:yes stop_codon:yes gene_type:complete